MRWLIAIFDSRLSNFDWKEFWRRGYASEAAIAVISHAFIDIGAQVLYAGHHPENVASMELLKKLGFRYVRDEYFEPTGLNHLMYSLEKPVDEWTCDFCYKF